MPNQFTTKGVPKRKRIVSVRYTDDEIDRVTAKATKRALLVSEYIRVKSLEGSKEKS